MLLEGDFVTQIDRPVGATAAPTAAQPERSSKSFPIKDSLRLMLIGDYRLLLLSNALMVAGFQLRSMGQAWLALEETNSAVWVGIVNASPTIGMAPLALYAGVIVDRVDRRRILAGAKLVAALMAFLTAFLVVSGHVQMWHLIPIGAVVGAAFAFNNPAGMTYITDVVGRERVMPAVSLNQSVANLVQIGGPAIGGALLATVGINWVFFVLGGIYGVAFLAALLFKTSSVTVSTEGRSVLQDLRQGWNYAWNTPHVRWLLVIATTALFVGIFPAQLPLMAREELGIAEDSRAAAYGALLAVSGVGALSGSLAIVVFGGGVRKAHLLFSAFVLVSTGMLVLAAAGNIVVAMAGTFLIGSAGTAFMTANGTLIQMTVSPEFRGRVSSVFMLIIQMFPLGWLIGGALAEWIGPRGTLVAGAVATLSLCSVAYWRAKELRAMD